MQLPWFWRSCHGGDTPVVYTNRKYLFPRNPSSHFLGNVNKTREYCNISQSELPVLAYLHQDMLLGTCFHMLFLSGLKKYMFVLQHFHIESRLGEYKHNGYAHSIADLNGTRTTCQFTHDAVSGCSHVHNKVILVNLSLSYFKCQIALCIYLRLIVLVGTTWEISPRTLCMAANCRPCR